MHINPKQEIRHSKFAMFGIGMLFLLLIIAIFGPLLTPYQPHSQTPLDLLTGRFFSSLSCYHLKCYYRHFGSSGGWLIRQDSYEDCRCLHCHPRHYRHHFGSSISQAQSLGTDFAPCVVRLAGWSQNNTSSSSLPKRAGAHFSGSVFWGKQFIFNIPTYFA